MSRKRIVPFITLFSLAGFAAGIVTRPPEIPFEKHTLDLGSSESAAIADIDGDGKPDIVSGENWYQAPRWAKHHFRDLPFTNNYIDDLSTLALDVDRDGRVDLITSGWFSKKLAWWKNPVTPRGTWTEHPVETSYPIEFTFLVDIDNDGKADEILPQFGDVKAPLAWYERGPGGLVRHIVSEHSYGHGIGVGDINGDGRNDILTQSGWFEAPADPRFGKWQFHSDWSLGDLGFIYVRDVNQDGRPDLITSLAHNYGIFWLEHKADGTWEKHIIDESWSQAHAVTLVDFRGSGNIGLLTGKRYMAHNGHDPGAREPLGVYWYERLIVPDTKEVEWVKHVVDYGGRTGGGIQIPVADIDRDGDLDFVVAGKSGLFLFENKTRYKQMQQKLYDVVVVGSGAGGGTLSARLAQLGADVLVLEGGPKVNTRTDFNTHALPYEFSSRHIPIMKPGKPGFDGERSRGLGGKTMLWNAVALRFSQRDFKGRQHDGAGEDWPIDYTDLAPYYERIEKEVGVCGNYDHLEDLPDGTFLPPVPMKCSDLAIKAGAAKLGIPVIHVRKSTLSRPQSNRPACHFCGNCMAGCDVVAKYNSYDVHMLPALRSGKLTLQQNSIVYELASSSEARINEVRYFDRETRSQGVARGRAVVVSCACAQSVALLLMSKSSRFPNGLANSSGEVGKNFIPHINAGFEVFLRDLMDKPESNVQGFLDHAYIPSFMHSKKRDYPRSFGIQFGYQNQRAVGWARSVKGMGQTYKQAVKSRFPAYLTFAPYQEMLPNADSFIDIDSETLDEYGLPRPQRHWKLSDSDWKLHNDMKKWCSAILESSNSEIHSVSSGPTTNHEIGGCRMGNDRSTSVLDKFCCSHDVPNLYVVDASVFPSASEKNPTHTIMALASRTADHILDRLQKREI